MTHPSETGVSLAPELPAAVQHRSGAGRSQREAGMSQPEGRPRSAHAHRRGAPVSAVLFTNVRIFDGSGAQPYPGEVLVQGNRISRISRGARALPTAGVATVDGGGATLMPGLVEAHTHFSWNDQPGLSDIQRMPPEEHILWCAHIAKRYLDMGFTSCIGAATAKPRLDVVIRQRDRVGPDPGPALPGGQPGDHGAGRPRRRDAAAPAVSRVQLRRRRQRPRGDAEDACARSSSTGSTPSS